jgi:hypothetical protein
MNDPTPTGTDYAVSVGRATQLERKDQDGRLRRLELRHGHSLIVDGGWTAK